MNSAYFSQVTLDRRVAIVAILAACFSAQAGAQTTFQDVTSSAGFSYTGESWGASWGDFNGDGLPDLFVNHHRRKNAVYENRGNGSFPDVTSVVDGSGTWSATIGDSHAGTWADFDNDGDQDLYVGYGGNYTSEFFVNENGVLIDRSAQWNPPITRLRARMPVWVDFTGDGLLDVIMTTESVARVFKRTATTFVEVTAESGISCSDSQEMYYFDVTGDHKPELICAGSQFPAKVYDISAGTPFIQKTTSLPVVPTAQDVAAADFNGDLITDYFVTRGQKRLSGADQVGPQTVVAQLIITPRVEKTATLVSGGNLTVALKIEGAFSSNDIWIGSSGVHPSVSAPLSRGVTSMTLNLSAADPSVVGMAAHTADTRHALYIAYDPAAHRWTFSHASGGAAADLNLVITSTQPASAVASTTAASDKALPPALVMSGSGGFSSSSSTAGFGPMLCITAAAADFDNDGDVDLYAVCRGAVLNLANRYFDNDGTGHFVEVQNAGGARGPTGYGFGLGENVIAADYDVDGDVDLFVTNGIGLVPLDVGGPDLLFRNEAANQNHWLELDLVAVGSDRDATGARVTLTDSNGRSQLREQSGGYHRWSQHDRRMHFGLGSATSATIRVEWPSGRIDTFSSLATNGIYRATEAGNIVQEHPVFGTQEPPTDPVTIRLRAGGPTYTDTLGHSWVPDTPYVNTGIAVTPVSSSVQIANTIEDPLYRTGRKDDAALPELTYSIPVPNGSYTLRLHFAELDSTKFVAGARLFDVRVENVTVVTNLDVFAEAGARAALIRSFPVTVSGGVVTIMLVHKVGAPLIRALEVMSN